MNYNQRLEALLKIGLEDYPNSGYSLIEERPRKYSKYPEFFSFRNPKEPIFGLFNKIEVVTEENILNRHMSLILDDFSIEQFGKVKELIDALADIYGADENRNLWLREEEEEEIIMNTWEGRSWDFPKNEDIWAVTVSLQDNCFQLTIHEMGIMLDF